MKVASGITFPLQNVKGWTEGIPFKEGGSGTLLPSHLGCNDSNGLQVAPCSFLMFIRQNKRT
jgi:hypothetical protein